MASGDSSKGTKVGTHVCCALGAGIGGVIGSVLGIEWTPHTAAFGATLGRRAGGTVS